MEFYIGGRGGGGGGAGPSLTVQGNGPVTAIDGVLFGAPYRAIEPVKLFHPDGIDGPMIFHMQPGYLQLGALIGANGAITTDQVINIRGAQEYIVDQVVICHATAAPGAMAGGIYTRVNKLGDAIVPASQSYGALTSDDVSSLILTPAPALRRAAYLYLSLTTANGSPLTFDVLVFGRVVTPLEG